LEFSEKIEQSYYFFIGMEDLGQLEEKWQSKIQKKANVTVFHLVFIPRIFFMNDFSAPPIFYSIRF